MAALSWRFTVPTPFAIGTNTADDQLAAINSIVTANSGAAGAIWEVATYQSVSPKYVLLKRKDGSAGRIIYFGQQGGTPNAAAIRTGAGASRLIVAYSQSSTSNSADASWLSAAPLSAADYMPGICAALIETNVTQRWYYAECSAGVVMLTTKLLQTFNATPTVTCGYSIAGDLFVHKSGTNCPIIASQGNGTAAVWTAIDTNAIFSGTITTAYSGAQIALIRYGGNIERIFRFDLAAAAANLNDLRDDSDSRMAFLPIRFTFQLWNPLNSGLAGKLRQIAFGPQALQEAFLHSASTGEVVAAGLNQGVGALADTLWIVNVEV